MNYRLVCCYSDARNSPKVPVLKGRGFSRAVRALYFRSAKRMEQTLCIVIPSEHPCVVIPRERSEPRDLNFVPTAQPVAYFLSMTCVPTYWAAAT